MQLLYWLLTQALGEFILTDPDMKIPARGKIFSVNEGYAQYWDESVTKYVERCKKPEVSYGILKGSISEGGR